MMSIRVWLTRRNVDASKKNFVATGIIVFDFDLFIGGRCWLGIGCRQEHKDIIPHCEPHVSRGAGDTLLKEPPYVVVRDFQPPQRESFTPVIAQQDR